MLNGINKFRERFKGYEDNYCIIGGTALTVIMEEKGLNSRATKDIDLVVCLELGSEKFVDCFIDFINDGKYKGKYCSRDYCSYRFDKPENVEFPEEIELFSKSKDTTNLSSHIEHIKLNDSEISISAILLEDAYYDFLVVNNKVINGITYLDEIGLIVLKAKAYINNKKLYEDRKIVGKLKYRKHVNDVIRLVVEVTQTEIEIDDIILFDLRKFISEIRIDNVDFEQVSNKQSYSENEFIEDLKRIFKKL